MTPENLAERGKEPNIFPQLASLVGLLPGNPAIMSLCVETKIKSSFYRLRRPTCTIMEQAQ
jgi:hypothetical protein